MGGSKEIVLTRGENPRQAGEKVARIPRDHNVSAGWCHPELGGDMGHRSRGKTLLEFFSGETFFSGCEGEFAVLKESRVGIGIFMNGK